MIDRIIFQSFIKTYPSERCKVPFSLNGRASAGTLSRSEMALHKTTVNTGFLHRILPYLDKIRVNTEHNFPIYFSNNFPVYHCIRTL